MRNIAIWLEDEIRLNKLPITFSIGTRYSNYRNDSDRYASNQDSQWTSRGAVNFTPTHWLEIFSSYAEGYRTPTLNEIYNDSKHFAMNYFTPNPHLQPERNQTIEYGVNLQFDNMLLANNSLQWRTAIFDTKATNYIKTEVHGFPLMGKTLSINTPSVVIHGIDSRINYTTPWFNAVLAYNRTHAKDTTSGMSISSIRPESLMASLDVPLANSGFSLGWIGQFAARTNRSGNDKGKDKFGDPIIQQAGYGTNDFYLYYQGNGRLSGINSTLSLTNAFNKSYTSSLGIPQEGRNIHFKINYRW